MKLTLNSWYAKLWQWFYCKEVPKSLCAFFWSWIIAFIFAIPLFIVTWSTIIIDYFEKKRIDNHNIKLRNENPQYDEYDLRWFSKTPFLLKTHFWLRIWVGILFYGVMYILFAYFKGFIQLILHGLDPQYVYITPFIIINVLVVVVGIGIYFVNKDTNIEIKKPKFVEVTQEYVKRFINQYCPAITWE